MGNKRQENSIIINSALSFPTQHSALYTQHSFPHSALSTLHSALLSPTQHSALYTQHSFPHSALSTLHSALFSPTQHSALCTQHSFPCARLCYTKVSRALKYLSI
uniref:Uncharacterized protein n=1 Tax=Desertifilum tharense IPPAS B-1220 TaxID=1781255 RepID=A0ACD5GWE7_9CYAN